MHLLITQQDLSNYGGSEVVTLELANHALSRGFDVTVLTNQMAEPFVGEFDKRVKIITDDKRVGAIDQYSHVWIHHSFYPASLLNYLEEYERAPQLKIAFHHMSPYVPIESPLNPNLEYAIADVIFFNSNETLRAYEDFFPRTDKLKVLGNPAPDEFYVDRTYMPMPGSVLVVSNHVPEELRRALALIEADVQYVGGQDTPALVTPNDIISADIVIAIGKTVQYSILSGTPVYCYDHFGGPGYLNMRNFNKASSLNFSGRGYCKKDPTKISRELVEGYSTAIKDARKIKEKYSRSFMLSRALQSFLSQTNTPPTSPKVQRVDINKTRIQTQLNKDVVQSLAYLRHVVRETRSEVDKLNLEKNQLVLENNQLQNRLDRSLEVRAKGVLSKITNKIRNRIFLL